MAYSAPLDGKRDAGLVEEDGMTVDCARHRAGLCAVTRPTMFASELLDKLRRGRV